MTTDPPSGAIVIALIVPSVSVAANGSVAPVLASRAASLVRATLLTLVSEPATYTVVFVAETALTVALIVGRNVLDSAPVLVSKAATR